LRSDIIYVGGYLDGEGGCSILEENVPKYQIVKDYITNLIIKNNINIDEPLPTESELMAKFGVSRHTIRKALDDLENEGWLYRKQGLGTFCADRNSVKSYDNKNIAVITTYINDYIFPRIIKGIDQVLAKNGYSILLFNTNNRIETEMDILENVLTKDIRGLIIEPTKSALPHINLNYFDELKNRGIPYIFINSFYEELNPSYIIQDDEGGGYMATKHLIKLGHRNIVGIFKSDDNQGLNRYKGYVKALRKNNIKIKEDNIIFYTTEEMKTKPKEKIYEIYSKWENKPTAIVSYNDQIAMWILDPIRELGYNVPDDISIVSFDDSDYAELSNVKLTSIIHPKEEMGRLAASTLFELIGKGKKAFNKPVNICIKPEIRIRNSTKEIELEEVL
jgi:GntR family transcriptional regulator of arabinose operon